MAAGVSMRSCLTAPSAAAPTVTGTADGGLVSTSTTSATIAVMLSGPPPLRASSTSFSTATSVLASAASVSRSVSSLTTPDRPSLHRR